MLTTIALMLLILWLLGLVTTYTLSGFIHLLLLPAIVLFVIGFFSGAKGRRTKFYRQPSSIKCASNCGSRYLLEGST